MVTVSTELNSVNFMDCELYLNKAIFKNQQFNMLVQNLTRTRKKLMQPQGTGKRVC